MDRLTGEEVEQPVRAREEVDERAEAAAEDDVEDRQAGLESCASKEKE